MSRGVWTLRNHEDADEIRARLRQGSADRIELARRVREPLNLLLALGLLREQQAIGCDPPFDRSERGAPRRYWLTGTTRDAAAAEAGPR